jgi:hypothetical protein
MEVAATNSGGHHFHDGLTGSWLRIRILPDLKLSITYERYTFQDQSLQKIFTGVYKKPCFTKADYIIQYNRFIRISVYPQSLSLASY